VNTITTHVLDLTSGLPAAGLAVRLERATEGGGWQLLAAAPTDADGRVRDWPDAPGLAPGRHRLTFLTGAHFAARGVDAFHPEVSVVFEVGDTTRHHHLPLLLSPFGYSTYRGS
jgi:5-hydroxyisourate hydrolase